MLGESEGTEPTQPANCRKEKQKKEKEKERIPGKRASFCNLLVFVFAIASSQYHLPSALQPFKVLLGPMAGKRNGT